MYLLQLVLANCNESLKPFRLPDNIIENYPLLLYITNFKQWRQAKINFIRPTHSNIYLAFKCIF